MPGAPAIDTESEHTMFRSTSLVVISLLLGVGAVSAEILGGAYSGLEIGAAVEQARIRLEKSCRKLWTVTPDAARIPVAKERETHLVCSRFKAAGSAEIERVVFTFGDDSLALVEARGGAVEALISKAGPLAGNLAGFDVYKETMTLVRPGDDRVWSLSSAAAHGHMFLWSNPAFAASGEKMPEASRIRMERPEMLAFGDSIEQVALRLEQACALAEREEIAEPWLPSSPERQTQINCYGFVYAGFPRKIEAVFGDGRLELAWILTGSAEEDRLRKALIEAYGPAETISDDYEVFDQGRVSLRKDKPEVLMLSDAMIPLYRKSLAGQQ